MLRFVLGIVAGALLSIAYVRFDAAPLKFMGLPGDLAGNVVSTATESVLYDLDANAAARRRALEVFFANRSQDAARIDSEAGYPLLHAIHRERVTREARQLLGQWSGYDAALSKPALRQALERKHGSTTGDALKRAMLADGLDRELFLKRWLAQQGLSTTTDGDKLLAALRAAARLPDGAIP